MSFLFLCSGAHNADWHPVRTAASASVSSQNSVHSSSPLAPAASSATPSNPPATGLQSLDLRHITSNHNLAPAMKERTVSASTDRSGRGVNFMSVSPPPHRLGSRSPASIPSSPTSVHSSSSAIFERDIELPPSHQASHPHPMNPHRTPRSKMTDPIEASVPSVLDSAAELLATTDEFEEMQVAVDAPATSTSRATSAIGSPIGRGSRSPSPTTSAGSRNRTSMLLNLPSPVQSSIVSVPVSPASPSSRGRAGGSSPLSGSPSNAPPPLTTSFSAGSPGSSHGEPMPGGFSPITSAAAVLAGTSTPSSVGASTQYESASSSPKTTTLEYPPHPLPSSSPVTPTVTNMFAAHRTSPLPPSSPTRAAYGGLPSQLSSHPPSPSHAAHKRLSFISYNDMIASTPVSTLPLSSLTSPSSADPPPHIPSVSLSVGAVGAGPGAGSRSVSAAASMAGSVRNSMILDNMPSFSSAADVKEPSGGVGDDLGGEWEREGLGRGLEERLETLMAIGPGKA
ncbi:hypothetical protein EW145_g6132 [Phellinidium pouzarii]|uniref:Uncharacterized protein n=1 Tax=Phellinidium pouzarii TaxID=167371 RepID=A0A4S4KYU1_9AGAM|nr:hypothetical protein EW145_g6132 [Phellinidium pouzarii]